MEFFNFNEFLFNCDELLGSYFTQEDGVANRLLQVNKWKGFKYKGWMENLEF